MTARRRPPPPPIGDENPPTPPPARQPPEPGVSAVEGDAVDLRDVLEEARTDRLDALLSKKAEDGDGSLLASMLASGASGERTTVDTEQVIAGLVKLRRRPVDPMTDYVADGTRILRFIKDAISHEAAITGLHVQEILRDVLLGRRQLSSELLDAHYADLYGHERTAGDR